MIELGLIVKDRVTGLIGVAENRASFLYGCDRYFVQPQIKDDGTVPAGQMVDEPQLEVLSDREQVMKPLAEPPQIVPLGRAVYDPISDRKGTATGRAVYLNGCSRIYVEVKRGTLGSDKVGFWVDEEQLEVKKKIVHEPPKTSQRTGGPARSCSKY